MNDYLKQCWTINKTVDYEIVKNRINQIADTKTTGK